MKLTFSAFLRWANYIPEGRYHELARPVFPDFKSLLDAKNPTALMVQFVIDALKSSDGITFMQKEFFTSGLLHRRGANFQKFHFN